MPGAVQAGAGDNVSGFAWSENIGWISFNNTSGGGATNYGVSVDLQNGKLSGYAWSEHIGWITFNEADAGAPPSDDPCPDQSCIAKANPPGKFGEDDVYINGWARALSYGGGWDGWIRFDHGEDNEAYIDEDGDAHGWAWGSDVVGWINLNGGTLYKVVVDFTGSNQPPNKPNSGSPAETWANCSFVGKSTPTFHWTYSDADGDPQAAYEIEVDDNSSFNAPKFNHLVNVVATTTSYGLDLTQDDTPDWIENLAWDTTYRWHVRVKDNQGNWSSWSDTDSFTTPKHAYPYPDFTFLPAEPAQGEQVDFNPDNSQVFGEGTTIQTYLWTITQGTGSFVNSNQNSQYPHIQFDTLNNKVKLEITDSDDYFCGFTSAEKDITVQLPLPEYKEIPPIFWAKKILAALVSIFSWF